MNNKRGQFQISFGMIFSILIIVAIVAVSFYVITYFLNISKCNQVGFFLNDLQIKIDKAWASGDVQDVFTGSLPGSVKAVCFGNSTTPARAEDIKIYSELKNSLLTNKDKNLFFYPPSASCSSSLGYYNLKHSTPSLGKFFCVNVVKGKAQIKLIKTSSDALVKVSNV